mgnify:FL=1
MKKLKWIFIPIVIALIISNTYLFMNIHTEDTTDDYVTLTIWGYDNYILDAFSEYQIKHPNLKLNFIKVDESEYFNKLKQAIALNEPLPDICILDSGSIAGIDGGELFVDLEKEPYAINRKNVIEYSLAQYENNHGHLWAVPATLSASGVVYNRNIASHMLGSDDPYQVSVVFSSWADVISKGHSYCANNPEHYIFANLQDPAIIMFGQSKEAYIQNNKLLEPYRFANYFKILYSLKTHELTANYQLGSPGWYDSLKRDEVFFYPCSLNMISRGVFDSGTSFGFTRSPSGSYSWGGTVWAIPQKSRYIDEAWDFLKTMLLSPSGAMYAKNYGNGTFISYLPAYELEGYKSLPVKEFNNQDVGEIYFDYIYPQIEELPYSQYQSVIYDVYLEVVLAMMMDDTLDADESYALFIQRVKEELPQVDLSEVSDE